MKAFFGTFFNKIDAKGRVSVPAAFRTVLQAKGLASVAVHPSLIESCLEGAGLDRFETLLGDLKDSFTAVTADEAAELVMEDLRDLPLDGDGRVVLPSEFIAKANLKDQAAFVGRGWKFQIWEPGALSAARESKLKRVTAALGGNR